MQQIFIVNYIENYLQRNRLREEEITSIKDFYCSKLVEDFYLWKNTQKKSFAQLNEKSNLI